MLRLKNEIRQEKKRQRNSLSKSEVLEKSKLIFENCKKLINENDRILCFVSFNNEVDTGLFYEKYKYVYAPKCINKTQMIAVSCNGEFETSSFGVKEPVSMEEIKNIDVAIVPGLAFDRQGNRIGFGAGYYDRYFEKHKNILKIAVCYDFQLEEKIEADKWDIKMDYIVTEKEIIKRKSNEDNCGQ